MKKTLLSIFAFLAIGVSAIAQNFEIYEGVSSTVDISGTTINATTADGVYAGYFYAKNTSPNSAQIRITRTQIQAVSSLVTEQLCWGAAGATGSCYNVSTSAVNYSTPLIIALNNTNKGAAEVHIDFHGTNEIIHYRYYLEDNYGVKMDSIDLKISNVASIKENKSVVSFNAYPNPADEVINLAIQGAGGDNSVKLIDVLGNVVLEEKMGNSKKLDVSAFRNGVYILTVSSNGALLQTRRIVVRH